MPESYQAYTDEQDMLLRHYFPDGIGQFGAKLDYFGLLKPEGSGPAELAATLNAMQTSHDRLAIQLTIPSPKGTRDSTGKIGWHAAFLGVDFDKQTILYQDPYGFGIDETETGVEKEGALLRPILEKILPEFAIIEPKYPQQTDKVSCMPITIQNMIDFDRTGTIAPNIDIDAIRAEQKQTLQDCMDRDAAAVTAIIGDQLREKMPPDPNRDEMISFFMGIMKEDISKSRLMLFWYESVFKNNDPSYQNFRDEFIGEVADYAVRIGNHKLRFPQAISQVIEDKRRSGFAKLAEQQLEPVAG